jgi:hypothetical protein
MSTRFTFAAVLTGVAISIGAMSAASAQGAPRTVEQFACKDVLREKGSDRDVVLAFLHGYLLGKSGTSKFDLEALNKQSDAFIERCLDNPGEKAVDAMVKVKG